MQLWNLLAQLEVINNQFALWLDTFTIDQKKETSVYSVITKDYCSKQRDPHFNKLVLCNIDLKTVW